MSRGLAALLAATSLFAAMPAMAQEDENPTITVTGQRPVKPAVRPLPAQPEDGEDVSLSDAIVATIGAGLSDRDIYTGCARYVSGGNDFSVQGRKISFGAMRNGFQTAVTVRFPGGVDSDEAPLVGIRIAKPGEFVVSRDEKGRVQLRGNALLQMPEARETIDETLADTAGDISSAFGACVTEAAQMRRESREVVESGAITPANARIAQQARKYVYRRGLGGI